MEVTETKNEGLSREYQVLIPQDHLAQRLEAKLEEIKPQVHLKGFRPGKAPTSFLKKLYGQNLMGELVQEEMGKAQDQALKDVKPAMQPNPRFDTEMDDVLKGNADLKYHMEVEVLPDIEPQGIDKLTLEKMVIDLPEDEIDDELNKLADQNKAYDNKAEGDQAEEGDRLVIDFKGSIDGELFEGGSAEGVDLDLGSNSFIPGFEEQLQGAKAGEERTINVTFPDDYGAAHLAGKEAQFEVSVKEVKAAGETTVDDEFAKKLGFDDLESLRERIKDMVQGRYDSQSRLHMKRALLDQLDDAHAFDLPPGMVKAEFDQIWQQVENAERDEEDKDKSDDELRADYQKIAERRVRLGLLLAEIGKEANVEVPQDELSRAIQGQAMQMGMDPNEFYKLLGDRPDIVAQIRAPLFEEKVVDHLIEKADVSEKKVTKDELMEEPGA